MGVSFDPVALEKGATAFTTKAEAMGGHATSVANLAALRTAFAGVGQQVWPAVEAELDKIRRQLEAVHGDTTRASTGLGATGTGATTIDQDHDNVVRNAGDSTGR
jgi:hypothetical protein